ncbi:hypothetical protein [Streptomyces sp. NPDC054863]
MDTQEASLAASEAEARAALVSRSGGPALDARELHLRAQELVPGEIDAGSDTETVLAALAGYAAKCPEPAGQARWGLDLVSGALRRSVTPEAGTPVSYAAGLTWVGALETALAQHCEGLLARRVASAGTRVPRFSLEDERDQVAPAGGGRPAGGSAQDGSAASEELLRDLRAQGEPVVHDLTALLSLPACALRLATGGGATAGQDTVVATGATWAAALGTAVARVLALRAPKGPAPHTIPAVDPDRELGPVRIAAHAQWSTSLDALCAAGHSPVAQLLDHDIRLSRVLPYVVRIVLPAK